MRRTARVFRLGYNTNGLAHHRPTEALALLAEIGYEGVAITPDVGPLDPLAPDMLYAARLGLEAHGLGLTVAVETGARYVLDPRRKHRPSLLEDAAAGRARRIAFYRASIDMAEVLLAPVVSIWSGSATGDPRGDQPDPANESLWDRLTEGVASLLDFARERGIRLALEPEPGMFLERPCGYLELVRRLGNRGNELGLTLDVGHLLVTGDIPVEEAIRSLAGSLVHVHLDDIAGGVHEHRMFGEGEIDLAGVLKALSDVGYDGMAAVELSRDSHRGPQAAREAMSHLRAAHPMPGRSC